MFSESSGPAFEFSHTPVLASECIEALNIRGDGIYVDGTLGGGGHASLIAEKLEKSGTLIGIDKDIEAIDSAADRLESYGCKKLLINDSFENIKTILRANHVGRIDGALLDLGVSSYQLDNPERGFSYMKDAPLDMRMNANVSLNDEQGLTAEKVIGTYTESELFEVIKTYGEERWAKRIAAFIVKAREEAPVKTTGRLTEIIKAAIPAAARRDGPHPAKRTFQAIRIEVNDELGTVRRSLDAYIDSLSSGGRLAVITFHSLEDRIVKEAFSRREDPCECPKDLPVCICGKVADAKRVNRKPILPEEEEVEKNPRARSAKLRVIEKL
ncbi:MAG: 16S rRNA (cytosine(1402)-N(4))-methyltransferase RsmH [Clostridiales Family XIII bacterium]|jgi:16S rRNA (cytosine1402-N4)-methyltransferase|nr:16S rRNA (cytosine(1402)-N(4))-methyltransferase RsmH [Clostridiales Family XIII bacterium]